VLVSAAVCPATPLLARELTGADPVVPELRAACLAAVTAMLGTAPDLLAVVGPADQARRWDARASLDLTAFAPALRGAGPAGAAPPGSAACPDLPASVGIGAMVLDQAGYSGPRALHSVTEADEAGECAALGRSLADLADRVALLVLADGSARRTLGAPGYLDERSLPFDAAAVEIISSGELDRLMALDAGLARELMVTGRPGWQVLAGAAAGRRGECDVRYRDDPFGVLYLVAAMSFASPGRGVSGLPGAIAP
jgi:hypothetical protein